MGSVEFVKGLLARCEAAWAGDVVKLTAAIREKDAPRVSQAAHALKGAAANLSAPEVHRLAAELETLARSGDLAGADGVLRGLEKAVEECRAFMGQLATRG
jgi:HPt (histidine-containing phosphotransfer) domain-containing protein